MLGVLRPDQRWPCGLRPAACLSSLVRAEQSRLHHHPTLSPGSLPAPVPLAASRPRCSHSPSAHPRRTPSFSRPPYTPSLSRSLGCPVPLACAVSLCGGGPDRRQVPRSPSSGPLPATSTHQVRQLPRSPSVFRSCCAKQSTQNQAICIRIWSDPITSEYLCIMPTNMVYMYYYVLLRHGCRMDVSTVSAPVLVSWKTKYVWT